MTKKKVIHLAYGIVMSLTLLALAICFIVFTINIYKSGLHPFTPERISQYFGYIAPLLFVTIALILGGIALNMAYPLKKERLKGKMTKKQSLNALYSRFDVTSFENSAKEQINRQRYIRITLYTVNTCLLVVNTILALVYLLNSDNFFALDENNVSVVSQNAIKGFLVMIRYLIVPFIFTIATVILNNVSLNKELEIAKSQVKTAKKLNPVDKNQENNQNFSSRLKGFFEKNEKTVTLVSRVAVVTLIIAFLIIGITNNGINLLIDKATAICKECIGMG